MRGCELWTGEGLVTNELGSVGVSHVGTPQVQAPGLGLYPIDKVEAISSHFPS